MINIKNIKNKRAAAMGEWVVMLYRLALVLLVAFIILGVSNVFYAQEVNVRDTEARLMTRQVIDCLSESRNLEADNMELIRKQGLFNYCNLGGMDSERFFVRLKIKDSENLEEEIEIIEQGDSGALWIKDMFFRIEVSGAQETKKHNQMVEIMEQNTGISESETRDYYKIPNVQGDIKRYSPGYFYVNNYAINYEGKRHYLEVEVLVKHEE